MFNKPFVSIKTIYLDKLNDLMIMFLIL